METFGLLFTATFGHTAESRAFTIRNDVACLSQTMDKRVVPAVGWHGAMRPLLLSDCDRKAFCTQSQFSIVTFLNLEILEQVH